MMNGTALHLWQGKTRNEYRTMGTRTQHGQHAAVFKNKHMTRLRVYFLGGGWKAGLI